MVTTVLEKAYLPLKDNRMPPAGFDRLKMTDTIRVVGQADRDTDYLNASGEETILYVLPLSKTSSSTWVKVSLHYETVPENWVHELFGEAENASEIERFKSLYENSENRTIKIATDSADFFSSSVTEAITEPIRIYPNPSNGRVCIEASYQRVPFSILSTDGICVKAGITESGPSMLDLKLPAGIYYFVFSQSGTKKAKKIVVI